MDRKKNRKGENGDGKNIKKEWIKMNMKKLNKKNK